MLPQNVLSTEVVQGAFQYPTNIPTDWWEDYEMGGIALQNPTQGLRYQPWYGKWDSVTGDVSLYPNVVGVPVVIFNDPDVKEFSFSFDQNMRWVACTLTSAGVLKFRWYDTVSSSYVTTTYPDVVSAKLSLDDKRELEILADLSDVILTYLTTTGELYFRGQRERYLIEHLLEDTIQPGLRITNFGMNSKWRMQWRLQRRKD